MLNDIIYLRQDDRGAVRCISRCLDAIMSNGPLRAVFGNPFSRIALNAVPMDLSKEIIP